MKILNLDNWCEYAEGILEGHFTDCPLEAEIIIVGLPSMEITRHISSLEWCPKLRLVATCTTGLDHVQWFIDSGIEVLSLQGDPILEDVWATAEHVFALILSLIRKVPFAHNDVCTGNWDRERWQGTELRGKTLGIVGYGRVGRQVAEIARGFGMNLAYGPWKGIYRVNRSDGYLGTSFHDFLHYCDIVTVHVPLTDETRGMFGGKEFAMMKPTAYFINTSRGAVVDSLALQNALWDGRIAGAALDVIDGEPDINQGWVKLAKRNKVILTPHLGGNTAEARKKTQVHMARRIKAFLEGSG